MFLASMDNLSPQKKIHILKDRADMLKKARSFFYERNFLEVDCPLLSPYAAIDAHIDLITAYYQKTEKRFMHSSPEYGMKRLLSLGMENIFQLSHVFRDGEWGQKHNPEFMMVEWYYSDIAFMNFIKQTVSFICLFLGELNYELVSYRDLFLKYTGLDYLYQTEKDLLNYLEKEKIPSYSGIENEGKDALLNLILGTKIEPLIGNGKLTVLCHYPASQSALAKTVSIGDEKVAERFEIYFEGVELANGYHELTDALEQEKRFHESNQHRLSLGKEALPLDENFLSALKAGLPDCCGVAVGFDRLMMLRHKTTLISDVLPFGWNSA